MHRTFSGGMGEGMMFDGDGEEGAPAEGFMQDFMMDSNEYGGQWQPGQEGGAPVNDGKWERKRFIGEKKTGPARNHTDKASCV